MGLTLKNGAVGGYRPQTPERVKAPEASKPQTGRLLRTATANAPKPANSMA